MISSSDMGPTKAFLPAACAPADGDRNSPIQRSSPGIFFPTHWRRQSQPPKRPTLLEDVPGGLGHLFSDEVIRFAGTNYMGYQVLSHNL